MKIKTLDDLKNSFDVISNDASTQIVGGMMMVSATDGQLYDIDYNSIDGYITSITDTDPSMYGFDFKISVGNSEIDATTEGQNFSRFTLLYSMEEGIGPRIYLDNETGYRIMTGGEGEKPILNTPDGYEYETLPDIDVYDSEGGLTRMHFRLEKYYTVDQITGEVSDYSGVRETGNEYYAGVRGPSWLDGYNDGSVKRPQPASTSSGSNIVDYMNGSKLYAAQKAWKANPANQNQQFDFGAYAKSNQPTYTAITITDDAGTRHLFLQQYYDWFRHEVETNGLKNIHSSFYDGN